MGELADRIRALSIYDVGRQSTLDELAAIAARAEIVELECESLADINSRVEQSAYEAEQRADALLVAVSEVLQEGGSVVALPTVRAVEYVGERGTRLFLDPFEPHDERIKAGDRIGIIAPQRAPNPELLERAATELMAEYVRVKAEEERKAREAADTRLREFAAGVPELPTSLMAASVDECDSECAIQPHLCPHH